MNIIVTKEIERDYYCQIFGKRYVSKVLGISLFDDDCHTWILAVEDNTVLGFCGIKYNVNGDCRIQRIFVFNALDEDLYKRLITTAIEQSNSIRSIKITDRATLERFYTELGFEVKAKRGSFNNYEKEIQQQ